MISVFDPTAQKGQSVTAQFNLTWTHYQISVRLDDESARRFSEMVNSP
jgi:hypothetical protein